MVRSSSEPRSNSPVIGNLPTSFWRARRVFSRIIHKNESAATANVNPNPSDLALAPSIGVQLSTGRVRSSAEIKATIETFGQLSNGAVIILPDPLMTADRE